MIAPVMSFVQMPRRVRFAAADASAVAAAADVAADARRSDALISLLRCLLSASFAAVSPTTLMFDVLARGCRRLRHEIRQRRHTLEMMSRRACAPRAADAPDAAERAVPRPR